MEQMFVYTLLGAAFTAAAVGLGRLFACRTVQGPIRTYPYQLPGPDFSETAGFRVVQLPSDEIIALESSWALDSRVGEMRFVIEPEWPATLRIGRSGTDLGLGEYSAVYDISSNLTFEGITVLLQQTAGGESLAQWSREGYDYALHFQEGEITLAGGVVDDFVSEIIAETAV